MADISEPAVSDPAQPRVWATKGPEFWALLAAVLMKTRPETLLELGGGRSTTFLADYAWRNEKRLVTFEQSEEWYRKLQGDLRFMGIGREMVHLLPLDDGGTKPRWYDYGKARRLIGRAVWDLVFVDGPQHKARRNERGQELVRHAAREARLIIVDDVHRPYNLKHFLDLSERFPAENRFFYTYGRNRLAISAGEWADPVRSCFEFLGVPYAASPPATQDNDAGDDDE